MTPVQARVVQYLYDRGSSLSCTYSWYVRTISRELAIPESTVKWCLNLLRDLLLIEAGTATERGIPLRLPYPGLLVAEGLLKLGIEEESGGIVR